MGKIVYDIIFQNTVSETSQVGGSILNSAISLTRLGAQSVTFISCIGNDKIGQIEKQFLEDNNINTKFIKQIEQQSMIALAFKAASTQYQFYGTTDWIQIFQQIPSQFSQKDILLIGDIQGNNLEMIIKEQLNKIDKNVIIYYDPNIRKIINKQIINLILNFCNIFRLSEDDKIALEYTQQELQQMSQNKLIIITFIDHVDYYFKSQYKQVIFQKLEQQQVVSTIGAGDSFNAGFLYQFQQLDLQKQDLYTQFSDQQIEKCILYGIKVSQHVCQRNGSYCDINFK